MHGADAIYTGPYRLNKRSYRWISHLFSIIRSTIGISEAIHTTSRMRWPIFVSPFYGIIFNCFVIDDFWGWLSAWVCVCVCSLYGNQMRNAVLVSAIYRSVDQINFGYLIWKCVCGREFFLVLRRISRTLTPNKHLCQYTMTMSCEASRPAERMEFYGLSIFDGCRAEVNGCRP